MRRHIDRAVKSQRKARFVMTRSLKQGGAMEGFKEVMNLEKYPETLDPRPITWPQHEVIPMTDEVKFSALSYFVWIPSRGLCTVHTLKGMIVIF